MTVILFSKTGEDIFGESIKNRYISVSLVLALVTLPLPRSWFRCLENSIYVLKDERYSTNQVNASKEKMITEPGKAGHRRGESRGELTNPDEINLDFDHGGDTSTETDDH